MIGQTHARGGTLGLLMSDVSDQLQATVVPPLGNSDHSLLSIALSMAQAVPNLCVSRRVVLKHHGNWIAVCDAIHKLSWRSIWSSDNPIEILNLHSPLLEERFVLTKVIQVGNKDLPWFNGNCRRAFDLEAHLR